MSFIVIIYFPVIFKSKHYRPAARQGVGDYRSSSAATGSGALFLRSR